MLDTKKPPFSVKIINIYIFLNPPVLKPLGISEETLVVEPLSRKTIAQNSHPTTSLKDELCIKYLLWKFLKAFRTAIAEKL